jgi:hypothetical protein
MEPKATQIFNEKNPKYFTQYWPIGNDISPRKLIVEEYESK